MKKILLLILFPFTIFGCNSNDEDAATNSQFLKGTKWKLTGIMDTQTNLLTNIESKDCDKCYTLAFDTDTTFSTFSTSNELGGNYTVDYAKQSIHITTFGGTKISEVGDGSLYVMPFWDKTIQSFSLEENELKLYYNENKNYLIFKRIKL